MSYTKAILPFKGQKRQQRKRILDILEEFNDNSIYIDTFGGSGLISRFIKDKYPNARVIYNDFDRYVDRIKNIPQTNKILKEISLIFKKSKFIYKPDDRIADSDKQKIIEVIKNYDNVDFLTLSAKLLFSGKYATNLQELEKQSFYLQFNYENLTLFDENNNYLDGLEITHKNAFDLLDEYKNSKNAVFVLDPPYLITDCKGYNLDYDNSYNLKHFLKLVNFVKNKSFIFFGSESGCFIEMLEGMGAKNFKTNDEGKLTTLSKFRKEYIVYRGNKSEKFNFFNIGNFFSKLCG